MLRRLRLGLVSAAAVAALTACTAPLPEITFYGNRATDTTSPSLWCHIDAEARNVACDVDRAEQGAAQLALKPDQPVQISVPKEVARAPWTVLFQYKDAAGAEQEGRTAIFGPGERHTWTLRLPEGSQLLRAEVQSGLVPIAAEGSGVDYLVLRSWILLVDPLHPVAQGHPNG